jgi:hypothetical protein
VTAVGPLPAPAASPEPEIAADEPLRPSTLWYWIGALIIVGGAIGGVVFGTTRVVGAVNDVDDWPRVPVPGELEVELSEGEYTLYLEYPGAGSTYDDFGFDPTWDPPEVELVDADGDEVIGAVQTSFTTTTYSYTGHEGRSFGELDVPADGTYTVIVRSEPEPRQQVALGNDPIGDILIGVFGGLGIAGLAAIVGLVVVVMTAVKRGRDKRRRRPPTPWGAPQPGGWYPPPPGAFPPPGSYPVPGYPPAPPGPGAAGPWAPPPGPQAPPAPHAPPGTGWPSGGT